MKTGYADYGCPFCGCVRVTQRENYDILHCEECNKYFTAHFREISPYEPMEKYKLKEATMQDQTITNLIAEHFPKTENAMLVAKWFKSEINCSPKLFDILIVGHEKEMLVKAKELEKAEKERAE